MFAQIIISAMVATSAMAAPIENSEGFASAESSMFVPPVVGTSEISLQERIYNADNEPTNRNWFTKGWDSVKSMFSGDENPGSMTIGFNMARDCTGEIISITKESDSLSGFRFAGVDMRGSCAGGQSKLEFYHGGVWHVVIDSSQDNCRTIDEIRVGVPAIDMVMHSSTASAILSKIPGSLEATCN